MSAKPKDATRFTRDAHARVRMTLPFQDRRDFEDAQRGFVARLPSTVVRTTDGRVAWELDSYAYQSPGAEAPDTVNPSLWRQAQLNLVHGLFEVAPGFYQVRGYDLSNMTLVEGDIGVIVIDPLISAECARAALGLYREHRGDRPVTAVIYTHSHVDHFGGVEGVVSREEVAAGRVPVVAPEGFLAHAVSENVYAGTAMGRRAEYMYGGTLAKGPRGQVDAGLGKGNSRGTVSLIAPSVDVTSTGQELSLDGVRIVFQLTPGTEAPAEMNFHFPSHRVLCAAENATHNLHNVVTIRGAQVRDALGWSKYLNETIELFGDATDALFAQHHWPCWGRDRITTFLATQRDLYRYLHDQTLRLLNQGHTGVEIAERIELPESLEREWHCRGYYGTVSHNVKAVYQRYMGWYDGNPANLWPLPPEDAGRRYVDLAGGPDALLASARAAYEEGEYRWVAQLVSHLVFADPDNRAARELEADALEQLGYHAESAPWRNAYLAGAMELRGGVAPRSDALEVSGMFSALTIEQVFDAFGARIDGPRAAAERIVLNWDFTDVGEHHLLRVEHGALSHVAGRHDPGADATITLTRAALDAVSLRRSTLEREVAAGNIAASGDVARVMTFFALLDRVDPAFAIVTP